MALAVIKAHGVAGIPLIAGDGQDRGGIQTSGDKYDSFFLIHRNLMTSSALPVRRLTITSGMKSMTGGVIPQQLMKLQLKAHRQIIGKDPLRQLHRLYLAKTGRKKYLAHPFAETMFIHLESRPFIIFTTADNELNLILDLQLGEIFPPIAIYLTGPRRLQIHHLDYARIHVIEGQRPTGFQ